MLHVGNGTWGENVRIDGATPGVDAGSSVDEAELQRQQAEAEAARAAAEAARVRAEIDAQTGLDGSNAFVGTAGATGGAVREEPELPSTPTGFDVGSLYAPSVHSQAPILDPPAPPPEVDARGSQPPANDAPTNDVPRSKPSVAMAVAQPPFTAPTTLASGIRTSS